MIALHLFDPDAASRAEWAAVHVFRRARNEEDAPDDVIFDDEEFERQARHQWPLYENRRWYAWIDDEIAGVAGVSFRRRSTDGYDDHTRHVFAWGGVRSCWRRRGIATRLLRPLLDFMHERNKEVATFETFIPEGHSFFQAIGATPRHRQIESRVPFSALDWPMLARWHDAAIPEGAPLRWEIYPHRVPRSRMELLNPQFGELQEDMPIGDLDSPPSRSELPAWLSWYDDLDRYGGDHSIVMLMDADTVVALCETTWDARFPDRVFQKLTAVARSWRGRGLAKGVKAAMLRLIRDRHPDVRFIVTSNANVNAPMLSINARLGFSEYRQTVSYQISPEAVSEFLTSRAW